VQAEPVAPETESSEAAEPIADTERTAAESEGDG